MQSVIQITKECWVCKSPNVHLHHIYYGSFRNKADALGMTIYLCPKHHNMSDEGVHFDKKLDLSLKKYGQKYYEEHIGSRDEFIKDFGRNYLWDE